LLIGSYPPFEYDARGGGGEATSLPTEQNNILHISFSSETFSIPPLTSETTRFLSLPLPPGLKIVMYMNKLEGSINKNSGEVFLRFESRFVFSIGSIFRFPDLIVKTSLQTGKIKGERYEAKGLDLQSNGRATLVGVAIIPKTKSKFLNLFLGLPNEALAVLECEFEF